MVTNNLKHKIDEFKYKSDWHIHTNLVDGESNLYENIEQAVENGLELIAITEHVRRHPTYNFDNYVENVEKAKEIYKDKIEILTGVEAKIININGDIDIKDEMAKKCDVILGVFHSWIDDKKPTIKRYLQAIENLLNNPLVNIWGHPLLFVKNYNLTPTNKDLERILTIVHQSGKVVEINQKHLNSSIDLKFYEMIKESNISYIFGSDAHHKSQILNSSNTEVLTTR